MTPFRLSGTALRWDRKENSSRFMHSVLGAQIMNSKGHLPLEFVNVDRRPERIGFLGAHDGILCFGGEDWWYHNRAHFDLQIMRYMAPRIPVLYINSVGFRMPSINEGTQFLHRIGRKLRSVARPISNPLAGFYVASLFSVPLWHRPFLAN